MKVRKIILIICGMVLISGNVIAQNSEIKKSVGAKQTKIKLGTIEVDLDRLKKEGSYRLGQITRRQKMRNGEGVDIKYHRRVRYFPKNKHVALIESKILSNEVAQGHLKVYGDDGGKIFETKVKPDKDGDYLDYEKVVVLGNHHVVAIASKYIGENKKRLEVYDINSNKVVFSTGIINGLFFVPPSEDYILLLFQNPKNYYGDLFKYDFIKLSKIAEGPRLFLNSFSNDGKSYVLIKPQELKEKAVSGRNFHKDEIQFYANDKLKWKTMIKYESIRICFSTSNRYLIVEFDENVKMRGNIITSWETSYLILDTPNGKSVLKGKASPEIIEKYRHETINTGSKK